MFLSEILHAVKNENLERTRRLLSMNVQNVNAGYDDYSNNTLLHKAAEKGYCKILNELLIHHADVNARNKDEYTALMLATSLEHYKIVNELIMYHADVNARNKDGYTALMLATL